MKQSSKRLVTLLIALMLFLGAIVIYVSFIQSAYDDAQKIKTDVASRQNLVDGQKAAIDQVRKLISAYQGQDELKQVVALALPTQKDEAGTIHMLNSLAILNRLAVQSIVAASPSLQNIVSSGVRATSSVSLVRPVTTSRFEIKLIGSYEDFKAFLGNLETNIRVFDVRSLAVDPAGKPNQDSYAYDIIVATYYQNQ